MRVVEREKTCTRCNRKKPWSAFWASTRWEDGTMRVPKAACKLCDREDAKERMARRRREDPDAVRAQQRDYRRRVVQDADRGPDFKERARFHDRAYRHRQGVNVGALTKLPTPRDWVPVGPFEAWIEAMCGEYAKRFGLVDREGHLAGLEPLSHACGLTHSRQLYRVLHESKGSVSLSFVDKCLTAEGSTHVLELYPVQLEEAA